MKINSKVFLTFFLTIFTQTVYSSPDTGLQFQEGPSGLLIPQRCNEALAKVVREVPIYNPEDVDNALNQIDSSKESRLIKFYKMMQQRGGTRTLISVPDVSEFDTLADGSPNFGEVLSDLKEASNLYRFAGEPMQFRPMIFIGEPGGGKTRFSQNLAKIINTHFQFISMESVSAGFVLTGNSDQWTGAQPGKVSRAMVESKTANPIILLDEIDKAGSDSRYDPLDSLHTLLEPGTAKSFKDEFVDVEMDASRVLWIATANKIEAIPSSIMSRFVVYEIPKLTQEQVRKIAGHIYSQILKDHPNWEFDPQPSDSFLDKMSSRSPREMEHVILAAFTHAFNKNRKTVLAEDVLFKKVAGLKRPIGFVN